MSAAAEVASETAAEVLIRRAVGGAGTARAGGLHVVREPSRPEPAPAPPTTERPHVRLVPTLPPARPRPVAAPLGGPPPTLTERLRVLKADDRSLAAEDDDLPSALPVEDPAHVARRLAGASVEVILGRRPAAQLARWLAPGVLDALRARAVATRAATAPPGRAPAVRGLRVCALHERVVEATAVVDDGRRSRAVALRLETHRGAWRATALEVG